MNFYISTGAVWLLLLLYAPLVLFAIWKLWKRFPLQLSTRVAATCLVAVGAVAIPLWDVMIISMGMVKLCPHAGIFVKRSVSVDGFYTNFGSPDMLDWGFSYVESRNAGGRLVVYSKERGGVRKEEFDEKNYRVKSRYEYVYDAESGSVKGYHGIEVQKTLVRDRETSDELGYAIRYYAYPGWVDRNTFARIGQILWRCEAEQDQNIKLLRKVILPIRRGEQ